jgi:AraC family L-rhamnose operon transcriptional activator RhaR
LLKLETHDFFRRESQFVVVEPRSPQPPFPLHEHDFHEIVIVASGNGWHVLNGEPHLLSCGEVFYLRTGDRHAFDEVHDLYLTNVLYRPDQLSRRADGFGRYLQPTAAEAGERRYWQISEDVLAQLSALLAAIARESHQADAASELMTESLFVQLLVSLWRARFATDGAQLSPAARFAQLLNYLRHNCTAALDLEDVARRFGYAARTFRRLFRDATSSTPHGYLIKLRLGHAMRALRATDDRITDIALASGFNDANYFSYAFSKLIGMSPSQYRERTRPSRRADDRRCDAS